MLSLEKANELVVEMRAAIEASITAHNNKKKYGSPHGTQIKKANKRMLELIDESKDAEVAEVEEAPKVDVNVELQKKIDVMARKENLVRTYLMGINKALKEGMEPPKEGEKGPTAEELRNSCIYPAMKEVEEILNYEAGQ